MADLGELTALAQHFVNERDWAQFHSPRNLAMALVVEAAELQELFLWCDDDGPQPRNPAHKKRAEDEAADVLLCLLNFCARSDIDLESAFRDKLARAHLKYPVEKSRGKATKYNELE